jgi:hypothetical protein
MGSTSRGLRPAIVLSVLMGVLSVLLTGTATAGGYATKSCGPSQPTASCELAVNDFGGGVASVDFDVVDPLLQEGAARWTLVVSDNRAYCFGDFRPTDPPDSFTCENVQPGPLRLVVTGGYGGTTIIGVRV